MIISPFPAISKAALAIARDVGVLNKTESRADILDRLSAYLVDFDKAALRLIDEWLEALTPHQFEIACNGEHTAMDALIATAPPGTGDLLDAIAENIIR